MTVIVKCVRIIDLHVQRPAAGNLISLPKMALYMLTRLHAHNIDTRTHACMAGPALHHYKSIMQDMFMLQHTHACPVCELAYAH